MFEDKLKRQFYFDPDDPVYKHHFPGYPVVPGSLILNAFLVAAGRAGYSCKSPSLKDFKFKHFLQPGCYDYTLQPAGGKIYCKL